MGVWLCVVGWVGGGEASSYAGCADVLEIDEDLLRVVLCVVVKLNDVLCVD